MPKFLPYKQGSSEWLIARVGILSASRMSDLALLKNGKPSDKRTKLMFELVAERRTGLATPNFTSKAMEWGIQQEPLSRARYEDVTGNLVELVGLAMHDEIEYWGASCDGLVGTDGCVEFKNPSTSTLIQYQYEGILPEQYRNQCLTQLAITGRKWCDFFAYDSRINDEKDYFLIRYIPTPAELEGVRQAAERFLEEVAELQERLMN